MRRMLLFASLLLIASSGCATGKDAHVVRTESGKVAAIGTGKSEPDARMAAFDQAEDYCKKSHSEPVYKDSLLKGKDETSLRLNLIKIPVLGKVIQGDDKAEVQLEFHCGIG